MSPRIVLVAAIFILPPACHAQKPPGDTEPPSTSICVPSEDDAAIYWAALTKVILKDRKDQLQVVLLSQTSTAYPPGLGAFTSLAKPDRKQLLDSAAIVTKNDFDAKAKLDCDLTTITTLSANVAFVSPKERGELFSKASEWKDFAQKYPNATGFTIVSAIGFNPSHNQALVYIGNSCGMLCGAGYVVLLEKKKDKWIAAKIAKIWSAS
jgi:hypothetical protein